MCLIFSTEAESHCIHVSALIHDQWHNLEISFSLMWYCTYNNHLIKKNALNVLLTIRHVKRVEDLRAKSSCNSIVIRHSKALGEKMTCHLVVEAKRLAALLLPCFIAAWCSPPLITCTIMLEASKWREMSERKTLVMSNEFFCYFSYLNC